MISRMSSLIKKVYFKKSQLLEFLYFILKRTGDLKIFFPSYILLSLKIQYYPVGIDVYKDKLAAGHSGTCL